MKKIVRAAVCSLLVAEPVSAQPAIDTLHFARPVPVAGGIPGLYRWAHSAESDTAIVTVLSPTDGQHYRVGDSIFVTLSVAGIAIGAPTQHADRCGLALSPQGQHTHIILDDGPALTHAGVGEPIFVGLASPGTHTLRVFACRSWHESIKSPGSFQLVAFVVADSLSRPPSPASISAATPILTYNQPQGEYTTDNARAILVDFLLAGVALAEDGHKIRLTVDSAETVLASWVPYLLTGLAPGPHAVRLELLTPDGSPADGRFTSSAGTIIIK